MKQFITTTIALAASISFATAACSGDGCKKKEGDNNDPALTSNASTLLVDFTGCKKKGDDDDAALTQTVVDPTGCKKDDDDA